MKFYPSLLLITISLLAIGTASAIKCSKIERRPQTASKSFNEDESKDLREQFNEHERSHLKYNKEIPALCDGAIRLVTYDVTDTSYDANEVVADLEKLNPTLVVIQKAVQRRGMVGKKDELAIKDRLQNVGLEYYDWIFERLSNYGLLIASKLPFEMIEKRGMPQPPFERRDEGAIGAAMMVGIKVGKQKIAIIGVDLADGRNADRQLMQAEEVLKFIKEKIPKGYDKHVLMGGFNGVAESQTIKVFEKADLQNSFAILKWPCPAYTSLSGATTDFIMLSGATREDLLGSYFVHTTSHGHLPIVVDLKASDASNAINETSKGKLPFYSFSRYGWYFVIGTILLLAAAGALAWILYKRRSGQFQFTRLQL